SSLGGTGSRVRRSRTAQRPLVRLAVEVHRAVAAAVRGLVRGAAGVRGARQAGDAAVVDDRGRRAARRWRALRQRAARPRRRRPYRRPWPPATARLDGFVAGRRRAAALRDRRARLRAAWRAVLGGRGDPGGG